MTILLADLRASIQSLLRNPGLALAAVLVLSLGLGANLTIFSFFNAALLRPLPGIHDDGQLVLVGRSNRANRFLNSSYPDFEDLRREVKSLSHLAAHQPVAMAAAVAGVTERVRGEAVSSNYFEALRTRIQAGRGFLPSDDSRIGEGAVAVISDRYWKLRFDGRPDAIGASIMINSTAYTIVGVAQPGFRGNYLPAPADLFIPLTMYPGIELRHRDATWLSLFGRLAPGYSVSQANAELAVLGTAMRSKHAADFQDMFFRTARFNSVDEDLGTGDASAMAGVLGVLTMMSLFLVCANVANLLLARATSRWREVSIRLSLGAGRSSIVRMFLAEGLILAGIAAAIGTLASAWCADLLASMIPLEGSAGHLELNAGIDRSVLGVAFVLAALAAVAFAGPAAWAASRTDIQSGLKPGDAGVGGIAGRTRMRTVFAAVQVALCVTLLACSGLVARSIILLSGANHGVALDRIAIGSIDLEANRYYQSTGLAFLDELQARLRTTPGVESVALARMVPFSGSSMSLFGVSARNAPGEFQVYPYTNIQSPGFFETLGTPLLVGRDFSSRDHEKAPRVAIINETLAKRLFGSDDPIGKLIHTNAQAMPSFEVIGVARDGLAANPQDGKVPALHLSLHQVPGQNLHQTIFVRGARPPAEQIAVMRELVAAMDRNVPLFEESTLRAAFEGSFFMVRMAGAVSGFSGLMAAVVSTIGLYGLVAFTVSRRTREIGIRLALGAEPMRIAGSVVSGGFRPVAAGLAVGLALSAAVTRILRSLLFGVEPAEPAVLAAAAAFVAVKALGACYLPARRASRVDPALSLRYE